MSDGHDPAAPPRSGAAPWERQPVVPAGFDQSGEPDPTAGFHPTSGPPPAPEPEPAARSSGHHTDGIPAAELIARLGGLPPRPAPEPDPAFPPVPVPPSAPADPRPVLPPAPQRARQHDPEAPEPEAKAHTHRPRHPLLLAGRSLIALIAITALVLTGGAWQWMASKNHALRQVAALDPNSRDIRDANAQYGDENFLIVGVDSRYGENSGMGAGDTEDAGGARSDSIILVNIPANRKRVVAVSFPRDLAITPMRCEAWNAATGDYGPVYDEETGEYGPDYLYTETKLNSAYSFGGPKCLVKVIQKISGLSVSRFMAVDFAGFSKMVDALGGVDVCSTTPLEDYELGTVLEHAGHQRIDGHTALNYVRARQVTTEVNGDYGRIKRQQLFLSSLLRSMISKDTFFSLSKLNNVVNTFIADSYVANITTKDLVDLGQSVQGIAAGRITFVTLPTTGITDADGNEEPYTGAIEALFDAIIDDDPLPGENDKNETTTAVSTTGSSASGSHTTTSTTTTTTTAAAEPSTETVDVAAVAPHGVNVHVSNSTPHAGLGSTTSTALAAHGFSVDTPDDYSTELTHTVVRYSPGNEEAAATVAASLGNPPIERISGLGEGVQVILGADFTTVGAPPAAGSTIQVRKLQGSSETATADLPAGISLTNAADVTCE
ncbi:MAG: LCP family protein [Mycolicibacterium insubricum]|jgi:LCP family protein required for cell wall assembly|nr:LCP family protein [Mycolicibacterium sp.]